MSEPLPKEFCSEDFFLDYWGLEVVIRTEGESSNYYIYDGNGVFLISGDSGAGFQDALKAAKNWIRQFQALENEDG